MAIITTSGYPSDQLGASGDYAIDPVAHFIYGPKTSSWGGTASSLQGPSGPGMVYGNGAPTSTQGAIGQGYLDLSSGNFYGPKASNGAWGNAVYKLQGAPGAAGLSVLTGNGSPTTNNVAAANGQVYIDTAAYNIYVYSNGAWGSATSLVGPAQMLPIMVNQVSAYGPSCVFNGQTMGTSTTGPNVAFFAPGTSQANTFTPTVNSAFTGLQVTNYGVTNATVYFYLQDLTANTSVYGYNSGNGIAAGAVQSADFGPTTYPLIAGHTYQWQGIRGSAGATYMQINPKYLVPSGGVNSLSYYPAMVQSTSINVAANSATYLNIPGGSTGYYRNSISSYLYSIQTTITGTGPAAIFTYNGSTSANHWATAPQIQLSSTPTTYTYGPFGFAQFPFVVNQFYQIGIYASGAAITVTSANSVMTIAQ